MKAPPYLAAFPTHRAQSPDEIEQLGMRYCELTAFSFLNRSQIAFACNSIQLPRLTVGVTTSSGHRATLRDNEQLTVLHSFSGQLTVRTERDLLTLRRGETGLIGPGFRETTLSPGGVGGFAILPGRRGSDPGTDRACLDRAGSTGRVLSMLLHEMSQVPSLANSQRLTGSWAQLLADTALECWHQQPWSADYGAPSLELVRQAEEIMEAQLPEMTLLTELAASLGVSIRTLQSAFRQHRQMTPQAFRTGIKLARVRTALLRNPGQLTVTDAALDAGFTSLGRFAAAYKKAYGESPSATLKQRRS